MKTLIESVTIAVLTVSCAHSAVLDFESVNGAVPVEGMSISNQFKAQFGMSFRREDGGYPVIGRKGVPRASFIVSSVDPPIYDTLHPDDPRAGEFGDFFFTDDGVVGGTKRIIIDFTEPVSKASGYVFDIDAKERMTMQLSLRARMV